MGFSDFAQVLRENRDWMGQLVTALITILVGAWVADQRAKRVLRKAAMSKAAERVRALVDNPGRLLGTALASTGVHECLSLVEGDKLRRLRLAIARCEAAGKDYRQDSIGQPMLANAEEAAAALQALLAELN